jgi:hypothetical protein
MKKISDSIKNREHACKLYVMFTRLKDGRQRFDFNDGSYVDFLDGVKL